MSNGVGVEGGGVRVVPADLQEVLQQLLEAFELPLQQLGRARRRDIEGVLGLDQHLGGHLDRRQRGPQLVRHVGDELALHLGQLFELAELILQTHRHVVERRRERGEVVGAADPHPLLEAARGQPLRRFCRVPDRDDHPPRHQRSDHREQDDQRQPGPDQRALHQLEGLLLLPHREQVVELVVVAQRRADREPGLARAVQCRHDHRRRVVHLAGPAVVLLRLDAGRQGGRNAHQGVGAARHAAGVDRGRHPVLAHLDHDVVAAVVAARVLQFLRGRVEEGVGHRGTRGDPVEQGTALGDGQALRHLGGGGPLLVQQQPVGDLLGEEEAEHGNDQSRQGQRGGDDAQLKRPAPAAPQLLRPLALPLPRRAQDPLGAVGQRAADQFREPRLADDLVPALSPALSLAARGHARIPGRATGTRLAPAFPRTGR